MYKQIYNKFLSHPIITLGIIQLILIVLVYNALLFHPNEYMFINLYDGLKNYFTFLEFITQEGSALGPFHFTEMNYPFGEYIFFTDNTPLLALPLRFIHVYLFNIEPYLIGIHNYVFIFNVFVTPILFFKIIQNLKKTPSVFTLLFCIAIAWINPQIGKLGGGVYNLSLSSLLLLAILIMQYIYNWFQDKNAHRFWKVSIAIIALIFLSAAIHLYYIPLIALPIGVFTFSLFLYFWIVKKRVEWKGLLGIAFSVLIGGFGFYFILQQIDGYSALRSTIAQGFDWSYWRFTPEAIFSPRSYNSIPTPMSNCALESGIPYESLGFLGNFFWYSFWLILLSLLGLLLSKRTTFKAVFLLIKRHPLHIGLFFAMLFTYATASGTYVNLCVIPLGFDNILSPFYFLHNKVDLITQFRCLARFSWMGFWIASIFSLLLFLKWQELGSRYSRKGTVIISICLAIILIVDTKDAMQHHNSIKAQNIFQDEILKEKFAVTDKIDFSAFQAILTIPAVQVGSEDYDITIDDQEEWTNYWMQLARYSDLPLFNCKMSRTALPQGKAQVDLFLDKKVSDLILDKVNDKPVLVVYSEEMEKNFDLKIKDYARPAVENGSDIISAFKMDTIAKFTNIYYLSWDIQNKH